MKSILKPRFRGFICTTAHPSGCAENVRRWAEYAKERVNDQGPRRVLVIGSSTGYGLASRIAAAFGYGADTVGVFFEREASGSRTATAGWYNNAAFEKLARKQGLVCHSINGDAFSDEVKQRAVKAVKGHIPGGQVDLVVYSLAAPKRTDPVTGQSWSSVLKPIANTFKGKTVDFHTGAVTECEIPPATAEEIEGTVQVMGGADWLRWMETLSSAGVLADGCASVAYNYIGPELTHPIYRGGTIGKAKEDLEAKAKDIDALLSPIGGHAYVAVLKGLVTQSSAAIPVVPLYISLLYKLMKEQDTHEDCIAQICRMYCDRMYRGGNVPLDAAELIRMDDYEMDPSIQAKISALWDKVDSANLRGLTDIEGYRRDFFSLFGFGIEGVDYNAEVDL